VEILKHLSSQFGVSVENALLYDSLNRKVRELKKSEERLSLIYDSTADILFYIRVEPDDCFRFLSINHAFFKATGLTSNQVVGKRIEEVIPETSIQLALDNYKKATKENRIVRWEETSVYPSGEKIGHVSIAPVFDEKGICTHLVGSVHDITERKKAELNYRTVADFTYDWEYWANMDGTLNYVSPSCERISGYSVQDFMDNPSLFREIIVQQDHEKWDRHYHDSRQELKPREMQFRIQRRDGEIRWIEHACQPVTDNTGRYIGFRASNRDITTRKQVEEGLQQSKEFNQSVLMSLPDHIAVLDWEGNILTVNDAWIQFARENDANFPDGVGPGVNYLRICQKATDKGDGTAEEALDGIHSVLDGSSGYFEMEYPCDSPTEKRWFLMTVSPFRGLKGGLIVTHINITSRKMAEIELRNAYTEIEQLKDQLEAESAYLQNEIKLEHNFKNIIGQSESLKYVLHRVEQVARTDSPVLIMGETGTGKELVARALHELSPHGKRALVKVNCAALPDELIESELFGREKGAFTGATTTQPGRFELAKGSTLFLDEIGELPLELQAKLLRVIESGEFERLGSPRTLRSDARIIAATNRVLEEEVRKGRFREDLWYRLKVFPITVPPLREHSEDIPLLAKWFVDQFARKMGKRVAEIPKRTMQMLERYPWPGNVRELKHAVESALITAQGKKLNFELPKIEDTALSDFKSFEEMERDYILRVLKAKNWRIGGEDSAASTLGMHVNTLRGRMKKLGIKRPKPQ
jgi:PAS domain S-box-containing protein